MNFLVGSDVITESLIRQRQDRGEGKVKVEVRDWRVVRKGSGAKDAGEYSTQCSEGNLMHSCHFLIISGRQQRNLHREPSTLIVGAG